jgi:hypothetical protein
MRQSTLGAKEGSQGIMNVMRCPLTGVAAVLAVASMAAAQTPGPSPSPAPTTAATGNPFAAPGNDWLLSGAFGFGAADGKYGDVLQKPIQ